MKQPLRAKLWTVVVVSLLVFLGWRLITGIVVDTNILSLLPRSERDPVIESVVRRFTEQISQTNLFLIGHRDVSAAQQAALSFGQELRDSGQFSEVRDRLVDSGQSFYELYFSHRWHLLAPSVREQLEHGRAEYVARDAERMLYMPVPGISSQIVVNDPLFLFLDLVQELPRPKSRVAMHDGFAMVEAAQIHYVVVSAVSVQSPFSRRGQLAITDAITEASTHQAARCPACTVHAAGMVKFAHATTSSMHRDISLIGTGSIIGIVLLITLTFGGLRYVAISLIPIVTGLLVAATVSLLLFPSLHLITLGFGASLIGVCIDYSFHFLCDERVGDSDWDPSTCLRRIWPGISIGALTSAIGYMALAIAPFPGLREMAVFAAAGVAGAYGTVVCWYPIIVRHRLHPRQPPLFGVASKWLELWQHPRRRLWLWAIPIGCLIGVGISQLKSSDDLRQLQQMPPDLIANEQHVRQLVGDDHAGQLMIVEAPDVEQLLNREQSLIGELAKLQAQEVLTGFLAISPFVPSRQTQSRDGELVREHLLDNGLLERYMTDIGFRRVDIERVLDDAHKNPEDFLAIEDWLDSSASNLLRHMWVGDTGRDTVAALVSLGGVADSAALRATAERLDGVFYTDHADEFGRLLSRYRVLSVQLLILAYFIIGVVLVLRYGFLRGILATAPAALASLIAVSVLAMCGQPFNLFTALALFLVLGIGVDYTIFLSESRLHLRQTMLALLMSAITTLLSFGLLSASQSPILHNFGLIVLVGIGGAFLLAPVATLGRDRDISVLPE